MTLMWIAWGNVTLPLFPSVSFNIIALLIYKLHLTGECFSSCQLSLTFCYTEIGFS